MSKTRSDKALLRVCIEDLHAGKRLLMRRMPRLARRATDPALRDLITEIAVTATDHAARLRATGLADGGPANLWMAGVLDDAARDARRIAPGPLLDVALIGAVRKARATEIVSDDTAIALAEAMGRTWVSEAVAAIQTEERASDQALAARLAQLARAAASLDPRGRGVTGGTVAGGVAALAAASVAASWAYWTRRDREREKRTRERLTKLGRP